jgi:hypothetical protein
LDFAIKTFIRGIFSNNYNLNKNDFGKYKDIIDFIKGFDPKYKISENNIALLKFRPVNSRKVPITEEVLKFVEYVHSQKPAFNKVAFLEDNS